MISPTCLRKIIQTHCCILLVAAVVSGCNSGSSPVNSTSPTNQNSGSTTEPDNESDTSSDLASKNNNARLPSQLPREMVKRELRDDDWFQEVAKQAGVDHAYRSAAEDGFYQLIESVGGGCAMIDYDQDGDLDLYTVGGGSITDSPIKIQGVSGKLFRNDGNWSFQDVTEELNLVDSTLFTHGCSVGDYNRDGWPDLFVAGYGGVILYRNEQGKKFTNVTQDTKLDSCKGWNVQGAWVDLDQDGWLDLYLLTYIDWKPDPQRMCKNDKGLRDVCGPTLFEGTQDRVFHNQGGTSFNDVSEQAGLVPSNRGLGVITADFNFDGFPEVFVANDVQENQLYLGSKEIIFQEEGVIAGVAFSADGSREGSMGVALSDINADGLPDLWYTNYSNQDNSLYQLIGPASFIPVTSTTGLAGVSREWVGFGTVVADFDHDNWPDIIVTNGHVAYDRRDSPYYQPAQLFHNQKQGTQFPEISNQGGPYFDGLYSGRGVAAGDLDNDGDLDLVIVHQDDPIAVLKNQKSNPHWVRVQLTGTKSNIEAIGAKVAISLEDRTFTHWVNESDSYNSTSDRRVLFSLPAAQNSNITVTWPSGLIEVFSNLTPNQTHELVEGMGRQASTE